MLRTQKKTSKVKRRSRCCLSQQCYVYLPNCRDLTLAVQYLSVNICTMLDSRNSSPRSLLPDVLIIIVSGIAVLGYIQYLIAKHGIGIIMRWLILLCVHIIWTVCLKTAISSGAIVPINYYATWLPLPLRLTCDKPTVLRDPYCYVYTLLPVSPLNPYQVLMLLCLGFL